MSSKFVVEQEHFEGPLDLLLSLIEKRKLFISDISLARVAEEYLSYLERASGTIADVASFLGIASTLLLLKSKSLLPSLELSADESEEIEELEERLSLNKSLKYFLGLTRALNKTYSLPLCERKIKTFIEYEDPSISVSSILETARKLENSLPKKEKVQEVEVARRKTLEEIVEELRTRIESHVSITLSHLGRVPKEEKHTSIITFLALLELAKQNIVELTQDEHTGSIELQKSGVSVPRYS